MTAAPLETPVERSGRASAWVPAAAPYARCSEASTRKSVRVGIGLAIGSIIVMPILGIAKQRLANQLGCGATAGEGRQNMLCAYLAGALLIGLVGNALAGAWWLDPVVGLLITAVALKEGAKAWRREGCCVASPLDGIGFAEDGCHDDCCAPTAATTRMT